MIDSASLRPARTDASAMTSRHRSSSKCGSSNLNEASASVSSGILLLD